MIYRIYCWYWEKVDDAFTRKIEELSKRLPLLEERRRAESEEFIRSIALNESILKEASVKPWFSSDSRNRRRKSLERLRITIEKLQDRIEELQEMRGKRRLSVPRSFFLN